MKSLGIKRGDFVIAALVLALGFAVFAGFALLAGRGEIVASVYADGVLVYSVELSSLEAAVDYDLGGEYNVVMRGEQGRICFRSSDCPDKLCVKSGWLSYAGQSAACLPARVFLRLEGHGSDADVIIR